MNRYVVSDLSAFFSYASYDPRTIRESLDSIHEVNLTFYRKKIKLVHQTFNIIREILTEKLPMLQLKCRIDPYKEPNKVELNHNGDMWVNVVESEWKTNDNRYEFRREYMAMARIIGDFCNHNEIYHTFRSVDFGGSETFVLELYLERNNFCDDDRIGFGNPCIEDHCYNIVDHDNWIFADKKCPSCGYS